MIVPLVSVVGKSGAGKTTLLESLIPELKKRGYRIVVVKHSREDMEFDRPGKDSYRLARSGAVAVLMSSSRVLTTIEPVEHDASLEELAYRVGPNYDLILTEGYKHERAPKIEVHRKELGMDLLFHTEELVGLVTDETFELPLPRFATNNVIGLANFIENKFLRKKGLQTCLFVNNKAVPLNPLARELVAKTVLGMVSAFHRVGKARNINIWLRRSTGNRK